MKEQLQPGDQVEVIQGDYSNFRGTIESVEAPFALVRFAIFGRVHDPIQIPLEFLRQVEHPV